MLGARSVSERQSPKATTHGAIDAPLPRRAARSRFALQLAVLLVLPLAACTQPQPADNDEAPDNKEDVKEHRDQWRPREAQSDFLDIGKQAGIEWLSFVPQDQLDYPEYFAGLDRDQERRLRLAPKGSDEQVLIQFDLPEGAKLWPVDWYGTELMAIDLPDPAVFDERQISIAIASIRSFTAEQGSKLEISDKAQLNDKLVSLANRRRSMSAKDAGEFETITKAVFLEDELATGVAYTYADGHVYGYALKVLKGLTASWLVFVEDRQVAWSGDAKGFRPEDKNPKQLADVVNSISIRREIALEGSPKHKCTSSLEEQLAGTLRFPDGTLSLPVSEDMLVRKIGGDSTIQVDGYEAEPWILIRRLDANEAEGDMRAILRRDTTFNRRLKVTSGKWSAGFVPDSANLPIVCFDYDDRAAENNLLGILKAGEELLTFEVVTRGVRDGEKRRAAKQAAIELLAGATAEPAAEAPELDPLIGWNMGTMGRDD